MSYQPCLEWLLRSTLNASGLIIVIFAFKLIARTKLSVRWHSALWLVLIFRMIFPWGLDSAVGLDAFAARVPHASAVSGIQVLGDVSAAGAASAQPTTFWAMASSLDVWQLLLIVWALGAVTLMGVTLAHHFKLVFRVKRHPLVTDKNILKLLESCKKEMGMFLEVDIVATPHLSTPAVLGMTRPRILLPTSLIDDLTHTELRHIFLHELAHIKRYDAFIRWLTVVLQAVHWFNPLVWIAFRSMRQDRELAADGLTLSLLRTNETTPYGFTLVRLLERFSRAHRLASIASFAESNASIKRRVMAICVFRRDSYRWSPAALAVYALLICVSLLSGNTSATAAQPSSESGPLVTMTDAQLAFLNSPSSTTFHFQSSADEDRKMVFAAPKIEKVDRSGLEKPGKSDGKVREDQPTLASLRSELKVAPKEMPRFNLFQKETDLWSVPEERVVAGPQKKVVQSNRTPRPQRVNGSRAPRGSAEQLARQINEYNADPKNKYNRIICREEARTGTNMTQLVCRKELEIRRRALNDQIELQRYLRR